MPEYALVGLEPCPLAFGIGTGIVRPAFETFGEGEVAAEPKIDHLPLQLWQLTDAAEKLCSGECIQRFGLSVRS